MAQAMRAILLASATAATLSGRRSIRPASQGRFVPCRRAYRMTAMAPATSSQRKCRLPCFEILPSLSLPPVECCLGTKPIHAARLRPDENVFQSPPSAISAVATIGPTPGISSSRRLSSLERCQAWMRLSMATVSALIAAYWRARTPRLNRAAAGMRSSCSSAMILSSSAVPLRPFAEMMPSSAICPRIAFDSIVRIVFAALNVGLYVARRHQPHRVAEPLKSAAPVMCARTCLNADEAGGQRREELQQLRSANAFADHYRAASVHSVNLKNRLRDIETDRANLAHGRLPSSGAFRRNHPMALRCRRVGAVHSIKLDRSWPRLHVHSCPQSPDSGGK